MPTAVDHYVGLPSIPQGTAVHDVVKAAVVVALVVCSVAELPLLFRARVHVRPAHTHKPHVGVMISNPPEGHPVHAPPEAAR